MVRECTHLHLSLDRFNNNDQTGAAQSSTFTRTVTNGTPPDIEHGANDFVKDTDKLLFSSQFRRLAGKTQVYPLASNDNTHNRLTHSLEVASVGRSLGYHVGKHILSVSKFPAGIREIPYLGDLIYTACLAHDIGNPPFGHAGENALRRWWNSYKSQNKLKEYLEKDLCPCTNCNSAIVMDLADRPDFIDFDYFEGNATGFHSILHLNLTAATLAAGTKYVSCAYELDKLEETKSRDADPALKKNGVYLCDEKSMREVALACHLGKRRHPFAYLVEAADDICNGLIDLEDAVEMKLLDEEYVKKMIAQCMQEVWKNAVTTDLGTGSLSATTFNDIFVAPKKHHSLHTVVARVITVLTDMAARKFLLMYPGLEAGSSPKPEPLMTSLKFPSTDMDMSIKKIQSNKIVTSVEIVGYQIISSLMNRLTDAALFFTFDDTTDKKPTAMNDFHLHRLVISHFPTWMRNQLSHIKSQNRPISSWLNINNTTSPSDANTNPSSEGNTSPSSEASGTKGTRERSCHIYRAILIVSDFLFSMTDQYATLLYQTFEGTNLH